MPATQQPADPAPSGYTVSAAAAELGIAVSTLTRKFRALGEDTPRGRTFSLKQLVAAMKGGEDDRKGLLRARREKLEAEAELARMELAEKQRDLVPMAEVDAKLVATFLPIRQRLMALPSEAAARCNPTDPQLAREALDRWVADSLPLIRGAVANDKEARRAA